MKAIRIHEHGGVNTLRYEEIPAPQLQSMEDVIVQLKAAALNGADLRVRQGRCGEKISLPHILGGDGAGIVTAIGANVNGIELGEAVCLYPVVGCHSCEFCAADREFLCPRAKVLGEQTTGTYAGYARVPPRNCFRAPEGFSFEEMAALPQAFLTAWRLLIVDGGLKPGEWVLICGIGGDVAAAAFQIASRLGTRVIVTSSNDKKLAAAIQHGAEFAINYRAVDVVHQVRRLTGKRGVDVVVDNVGGDNWIKSLAALAKGGRLATCGATASWSPQTDLRRVFWNHLKISGGKFGSHADFRQVLNFLSTSRIKPIIDSVHEFGDAARAHQRFQQDERFGKVVLRIDS